jgi:glutamyl-tRNA synthetase
MPNIKKTVLKYTLQNAVRYKGKAQLNNVIPKVIGEIPSVRSDMTFLISTINKTIKEVNLLTQENQIKKLQDIAPELLEEKPKEEKKLKELEDTKNGVVMRLAPSPSGPMHIGHAITGALTSVYVKKYNGKFILRIEDTNPENVYSLSYKSLSRDADWVFGNISEVWIQSDRIKIYYTYAEKFIKKKSAYVCTCNPDRFRQYSKKMENCPCRPLSIKETMKRWKEMLNKKGLKQGEAVLRFKSRMTHNNPAMRDFPLARINESKHPRQGTKYRVWPLMNLAVLVDDIEAGMTHIIRGKDHADNAKRQEFMYKVLHKQSPKTYFIGRYRFKDLEISCSKTRERIKQGEFSGWDDIRLPFLEPLRRRGFQPSAFIEYSKQIGLSLVDKVITAKEFFKTLNAFNKEILDPISDRYFFIPNPVRIIIKNAPKQTINIRLHPNNPKKGTRQLKATNDFYLAKDDVYFFKNNTYYRLMECLNFKKEKNNYIFDSKEITSFKNKGKKIIHWLPYSKTLVNVEVLMPNNKFIKGFAESATNKLKQGDTIQFERFGFCRLDKKMKNKLIFWFAHK